VIGDQAVIAQAMATGIVDGALLGYSFSKVAQRTGSHLLADLTKLNIPYQHQGLLARRSFVDSSPDVAEKTLRSLMKAIAFIKDPANKQAVTRSLVKWLRLPPSEAAEGLYARMNSLYDRRIAPTREGLQNALRVLGRLNPKMAALTSENLLDDRIARRLDAEGF
jgi:ABC-type nitrate/sulfonate/bicarbonate transport system substrate-binding protein